MDLLVSLLPSASISVQRGTQTHVFTGTLTHNAEKFILTSMPSGKCFSVDLVASRIKWLKNLNKTGLSEVAATSIAQTTQFLKYA